MNQDAFLPRTKFRRTERTCHAAQSTVRRATPVAGTATTMLISAARRTAPLLTQARSLHRTAALLAPKKGTGAKRKEEEPEGADKDAPLAINIARDGDDVELKPDAEYPASIRALNQRERHSRGRRSFALASARR